MRAIEPTFELTERDADAVASICRKVDGLPLTLELAAGRVRVIPPASLAEALEDPLRVLASGARDLPQRHRSLQALLDSSYELLSDAAATVLQRLAVFDQGWSLPAAEVVVDAAGPVGADLLDALDELLSHNLVQGNSVASGTQARFSMLRTTRAHAFARLASGDGSHPARAAHARWFVDLVDSCLSRLHGPEQLEQLERSRTEHANVEVAAHWLEHVGESSTCRRLALGAAVLCEAGGHVDDGERWVARGLALEGAPRDAIHAGLLGTGGALAWRHGALAEAIDRLEEALVIHASLDETVGRAHTLYALGRCLRDGGDHDRAVGVLQQGLRTAEASGTTWLAAMLISELGGLAEAAGDVETAGAQLERAAQLAASVAEPAVHARVGLELASLALHRGEHVEAGRHAVQAGECFEALGDRGGLQEALLLLGGVQLAVGRPVETARFAGAAEALDPAGATPRAARWATFAADARRVALREAHGLAFADAWTNGRDTPITRLLADPAAVVSVDEQGVPDLVKDATALPRRSGAAGAAPWEPDTRSVNTPGS